MGFCGPITLWDARRLSPYRVPSVPPGGSIRETLLSWRVLVVTRKGIESTLGAADIDDSRRKIHSQRGQCSFARAPR